MPEGHTVHRVAGEHRRKLAGETLAVSSPQGRFDRGARELDGRRLADVEPLGKHLLYRFDGLDDRLHIHLGRYGRLREHRRRGDELPDVRGAVRLRLATTTRVIDLSGPTACELMDPDAVQRLRDRIGPDLLAPKFDRDAITRRILSSRAAIGTLLMDQSVVSGIGNIYRCELLYRARLDPRVPGRDVDPDTLDALLDDAVTLMKVGVRHGLIRTVEPDRFGKAKWSELGPGERFWIYRRERCRGCGGPIEQWDMAGRDCFACPAEQH